MVGIPTLGAEQLTIGDVELIGKAWTVKDVSDLWTPARLLGSDAEIPGEATIPRRRRRPPKDVVLPMAILSNCDSDGVQATDALEQLEENIAELLAIVDLLTSDGGTRELVLTRASGATWGADVHVLALDLGRITPVGTNNAGLVLSIPDGKLTEIVEETP